MKRGPVRLEWTNLYKSLYFVYPSVEVGKVYLWLQNRRNFELVTWTILGLSITELLPPRSVVWASIRLIIQLILYFHPIRAENLVSYLWIWNWMAFLTRFRISTEKWNGKRVFEAAGSAWGPTSTFTKNAGKWIHTDNQIQLTLTTPSFSCLAFLKRAAIFVIYRT